MTRGDDDHGGRGRLQRNSRFFAAAGAAAVLFGACGSSTVPAPMYARAPLYSPGSVGRESEIGTRARPYAAFIAAMHRRIHDLWAFSFLPLLDSRGAVDPFNDMSLYTVIAIVLTDGGAVESAKIVRTSGYLPFDTAARDVIVRAGPFPKPPEAIRSYDGKVYIDWALHRDGRECSTDFVQPHILTNEQPPASTVR